MNPEIVYALCDAIENLRRRVVALEIDSDLYAVIDHDTPDVEEIRDLLKAATQ